MRQVLQPQINIAKERYPVVLQLIKNYIDFINTSEDIESVKYQELEAKLHELTGKNISNYSLMSYMEVEAPEVVAFQVSLPEPTKVDNISKDELFKIVKCIETHTYNLPEADFWEPFKYHLVDYYHSLLRLNFTSYKFELFSRRKDKAGNYTIEPYSTNEIVEIILGNKPPKAKKRY